MATFDGERYVEAQIVSILAQLAPDDELVISDDGSTDRTVAIARAVGDGRIVLRSGPGQGPARNFAAALAHARNDAIFLSDQDDVWEPDKVSRQLELLERYPLVVSDCRITDEAGRVTADSYFAVNRSGPGLVRNIVRNGFLGCCMAFRRTVLERAAPIPHGVAHDWWIGMVAQLSGEVLFLQEPLVRYRRHSAAASVAGARGTRSVLAKFADRIALVRALARLKLARPRG